MRNKWVQKWKIQGSLFTEIRDIDFPYSQGEFLLLSLNTSTTVTKVETHNDCIVRLSLWHILWHILQRHKSFFLPFLLVGPDNHNSTHSFLFYNILNFVYIFFLNQCFQVTCSWYGFPGCCKCNSSKTNWDVPGDFLYSTPSLPPNPTTRRCSRAICFLNSSYLF